MSNELKPCPFCGGEVYINVCENFVCKSCGVTARFPLIEKQRINVENGLMINNFDTEHHTSLWNTRYEKGE